MSEDMSASEMPPPTQGSGKSVTVYRWVILFLYSEDTEFPFTCVPLSAMENSNFPFSVRNLHLIKLIRYTKIDIFHYISRLSMVPWTQISGNSLFNCPCFLTKSDIAFLLKLRKVRTFHFIYLLSISLEHKFV